ncbi:Na+/H+ antiporter [Williamsia sp. 1135]|uniref:Na+/H+ antiporter n=1 Tax=Williamsia sp. 1135 TaxID=1889262 RepID=UPI000A100103|nr:Na+/H+ antiporter [Williamsia sp. 1135]ORM37295.1 Na+/H+ antiporter [Williamsia sp. 1135]
MNEGLLIVAVVAVIVSALCRRYGLSGPLVLVVVGLGVGWIPGLPDLTLEPELVLFAILPPLLYSAAQDSSYVALRKNIRAVGLLAVGLPLATAAGVGVVAYYAVPDLPWAAAFVLGAIVAPPDAVSAQAVGRRLGLPRRVMTLLGGESLLNDATALTAYRLALAAAIGATTTVWDGILAFLEAAIGGVVIGMAAGIAVAFARHFLDDPPMETALGILAPFVIYFVAEEIHASGVIAVVVAGLYLGQRSVREGYATRLQDNAVWKSIDAILESFVFLLIGLQLPQVIEGLDGRSINGICWAAAAVFLATVLIRIVWVYAATYGARLFPRIREREVAPSAGAVFVLSWAGMRGVVSLAAAFAIPLTVDDGSEFPARDAILFLTFVVVVGSLLLQGTTLPLIIKWLGVQGDDHQADLVSLARAQDRAGRAAITRLDEIAAKIPAGDARSEQVEILRHWIRTRKNLAWEGLGRDSDELGESPTEAYNRIRNELIQIQREVFIDERDRGRIDDEVLRSALRQLDLAEGLGDSRKRL